MTDINGCSAEDLARVIVRKDYHAFIPTVFSPNGDDGANDVFMIFAGKEEGGTTLWYSTGGESVLKIITSSPTTRARLGGVFQITTDERCCLCLFCRDRNGDGQVVVLRGCVVDEVEMAPLSMSHWSTVFTFGSLH